MTPRHNPTAPNRNEAMRSASEIAAKQRNKRARDRKDMADLRALEEQAQDEMVLLRLQNHLGEMHSPLGYIEGHGSAWNNLHALEALHLDIHRSRDWGHSH